jgi:hypothetical protein
MKRALGVAPLVLLTSLAAGWGGQGPKAEDGLRHEETAGGFSFVPPKGWTIREFPGLKFKIAAGPAAAGFAPNINVVDESFGGSLAEYVKLNLDTLPKVFQKSRVVNQGAFKTNAGLEGARAITENEQNGKLLRQTFYFFPRGDRQFVVTCSVLAEGGEKLDAVFEASMKTFRFDKK